MKLKFREDKSWELPLPNGDTLHRIDIFIGEDLVDSISVSSKYLKYFIKVRP